MRTSFRAWAGLLLVLVGLLGWGLANNGLFSTDYRYHGSQLDPAWSLPDFELTDTQNRPFRLSDVEGRLTLVYFGYTYCPDVCPLTLMDIKTALTGLPNRERVQVIFITVDPARDTPEVLARYLRTFDPTFIGLTGDSHAIETIYQPYRVVAEQQSDGHPATGYLVDHTARLYLVNPQRQLQFTYAFDFDPADLRSDLEQLLQAAKS